MFSRDLLGIRAAWEALGDMPATEAGARFVAMLLDTVPAFRPWLNQRLAEKAEQDRLERERIENERYYLP